MADRRMFSKNIIDSDAFLDMPLEAQALYFHLAMRADDDGFVNNPKKIIRMISSSEDSFKILVLKCFILPFESGIIVIKHWRIHNYIQKDRYKSTMYTAEKQQLTINENGEYTLIPAENIPVSILDTTCIQPVSIPDTQVSIGKSKDSLDKDNTYCAEIEEIISYLNQKAGTNYRTKTETTRSKIRAKLNANYTVDDLKTVIDKKCAEWIGTEYEKYLRPETLFGNKFESYLNAKVNPNAGQQGNQNRQYIPNAQQTEDDYDWNKVIYGG